MRGWYGALPAGAHARRKVLEPIDNHPVAATTLLAMYQDLYVIEDRGKGLDAGGLLELRQTEAVAVWDRMEAYLQGEVLKGVVPKEAMS